MKRYRKLWSIVLAIAMILSIVVPSSRSAQASREPLDSTITVNLHKLLMSQEELDAWDSDLIEKGTEGVPGYNGTQNLTGLQEILTALGKQQTLKEIPNVYFAWQNAEGKFIDKYGLVVGDGTDPSAKHWVLVQGEEVQVVTEDTEGAEEVGVLGGLTTKNGLPFDVSFLPQPEGGASYKIAEIPELTTYKGDQQEDLAAHKAVPVEITLPLINENGIVTEAHVYPKNTENKPSIDKNFAKEVLKQELGEWVYKYSEGEDGYDAEVARFIASLTQDELATFGADIQNYENEKAKVDLERGMKVPYEVLTVLKQGMRYETAVWTDTMEPGLTYNKDLKIVVSYTQDGPQTLALDPVDYRKTETASGFTLEMTETGLAKLRTAAEKSDVNIQLQYTATTNDDLLVDTPVKNHVSFQYGNNKTTVPTPKPQNPSDNKIVVNKTWATGEAPAGVKVTYFLWLKDDVNGDKVVDVKTVSHPYTAEFTGLDNDKQYYVTEIAEGYAPEYLDAAAGQQNVKNNKVPGGDVLVPGVPSVVTHGKKFVKTNADGSERLNGAAFYVKRTSKLGTPEYLALKDGAATEEQKQAYQTAEAAYQKAINDFNAEAAKPGYSEDTVKITVADAEVVGKTAIEAKIAELKETRDDAYTAMSKQWTFIADKAQAFLFTSNSQGQFEINGIEKGEYSLEEVSAPIGYAKQGDFAFEVTENSYTQNGDIDYDLLADSTGDDDDVVDNDTDAQQVINKKISIPQTGGMGTIIFTVVGLAIMGGALLLRKKNRAEEA
ncbi:MAG: pilin N-terminal domain-containing protein [Peptoniphilaceae bacterium]|nr:pilin N-terminal domain-containing protein [Peptoniphilaceae bacterium]MDY3075140.1 pilin N-terminal domain-containing protein [Peptoniphilaceae bacterium]MDY4196674.1 pilin N-terminal domain-containing protein [Peptoniphilaceae bacterium]